MKTFLLAMVCLFINCAWNVQDIKEHAQERLSEFDYVVIAYEGYQHSFPDGGQVWYQVYKKGDKNKARYSVYLTKWNGEYHVYGPTYDDKNLIINNSH